jgi:cytidylate kinase
MADSIGNRQITIDGPAASGKSTVAQQVAEQVGAFYINTGLMYRTLTWVVRSRGIDPDSHPEQVEAVLSSIDIQYERRDKKLVLTLDGEPVDLQALRHPTVTALVSQVARIPGARRWMVERQQRSARIGWVVAEGRDMGTVVFPEAQFKFYLSASPEERARRRLAQDGETTDGATLASVVSEITERDRIDSTREIAPLRPADDARQIDTTGMTIEEVVGEILNMVKDK